MIYIVYLNETKQTKHSNYLNAICKIDRLPQFYLRQNEVKQFIKNIQDNRDYV